MTAEFDVAFDELMGQIGSGASATRKPAQSSTERRQQIVAPTRREEPIGPAEHVVLPNPDDHLRDVARKLTDIAAVISRGAYLAPYLGEELSDVAGKSPEEIAKMRATIEEVDDYDWWVGTGKHQPFNWSGKSTDKEFGAQPSAKDHKETQALRLMFSDRTLTTRNLFWIRQNQRDLFNVVKFYEKMIGAAIQLKGGVATNDPVAFQEYLATNKAYSSGARARQVFMEAVNKLLNPIDYNLQIIDSRRRAMGEKCGIASTGGNTYTAKMQGRGLPTPAVVSQPDQVPRGKRTLRDMVGTTDELAALHIKKRSAVSGEPSAAGREYGSVARRSGHATTLDVAGGLSAQVTHGGETVRNLSTNEYRRWKAALHARDVSQATKRAAAELAVTTRDREQVTGLQFTTTRLGDVTAAIPATITTYARFLCQYALVLAQNTTGLRAELTAAFDDGTALDRLHEDLLSRPRVTDPIPLAGGAPEVQMTAGTNPEPEL